MALNTITSANAIFMLGVASVFPTPQQLQGFAADDVFSTDPLESAETIMGVDGIMSAGFVFVPVKQAITLQADSDSNDLFDQWWAAQQTQKDVYFGNATVVLKSINRKWTMTRGVLSSYPPIPDAKRVLQPRKFGITWNAVSPAAA